MDEYLSHDKDNMLYCSGLDEHDHQLGADAELHVGAVFPLPNKPANRGSKKDNNLTCAGSCDAPSESGGEEEGTLMRQEQAEDKEHTDMDCMVVMEQTRSEQVDNKTRQEQASRRGMEEAGTMQEQASKREMMADYALPVAVITFSFIGSYLFSEVSLDQFYAREVRFDILLSQHI